MADAFGFVLTVAVFFFLAGELGPGGTATCVEFPGGEMNFAASQKHQRRNTFEVAARQVRRKTQPSSSKAKFESPHRSQGIRGWMGKGAP
ncbi:hypothetical protein CEXT_334331 [Caerostris extrusa]|uniref:Secreted protein n=1 Tax=Caerostris extrusa TaxID=172846 RepID=A0AAV4QFD1_CAEEX|nr:hypothetical protein CEXT_334331 [Caerostris extrusa]